MIKVLKKILLDLNVLLGKAFYKSYSGFLSCSLDHWKIVSTPSIKTNVWTPVIKKAELGNFNIDSFPEARGGNDGFTTGYTMTDIPDFLKNIIKENYQEIKNYIGEDFIYESPIAYRTDELPRWAMNYDVYSNIWHMDSHDGTRFLKIFVALTDVVDDQDGPFIYLEREATKSRFTELWHRWTFDNLKKGLPQVFPEEKKFITPKGGYVLVNTADCFHRASSPTNGRYRKMLQITLYPKWLNKKSERRYPIKAVL